MKAMLPRRFVRSANGMTDDLANRVFEGWYGIPPRKACFRSRTFASRTGEPYHKHALYDGASHVISALPPGGPHPSSVRVILNEDIDLLLDAPLDTAQTRVAWPDGIWTSFVVGTGNDGVNDFIDIDATGDFAAALPLLESGAAILSVFDAFDATFGEGTTEVHTAGVWTSVTYNDGPDTTTLTHDDGDPGSDLIASYMEGWFVQLNADLPVVRTVLSVSGDSITVAGKATSIAGAGDTYCIMHPPGVDVATGATQTDPCVSESRYLWAHGLYYAPVVGFYMLHEGVLDIHGAQPGSNLSGQYYFWNRVLDSLTGRWTTPDPASTPWSNLHDYVGGNPLNRTDITGLFSLDSFWDWLYGDDVWGPAPDEDAWEDREKQKEKAKASTKPLEEALNSVNETVEKLTKYVMAKNGNFCGPGGGGSPTSDMDECCEAHDACFEEIGVDAAKYVKASLGIGSVSNKEAWDARQCDKILVECVRKALEGGMDCAIDRSYAKNLIWLFDSFYKDAFEDQVESREEEYTGLYGVRNGRTVEGGVGGGF